MMLTGDSDAAAAAAHRKVSGFYNILYACVVVCKYSLHQNPDMAHQQSLDNNVGW